MRIIYSKWTYEELGRPTPGREGAHPITVVSWEPHAYDTQTQFHLDIDEAVNGELCADIMTRTGAYSVVGGELYHDPDWEPEE